MQLGVKRSNFVSLAVLSLVLASFALAAGDPPAAPPEPGSLIILGQSTAIRGGTSTVAFAWDRKAAGPRLLSSPQSVLVGNLSAIALARDGRYYYLSANNSALIRTDKDGEEIVYRHNTYVRDLALDNKDNVYFSEATGAKENGKIYRVIPVEGGHAVKTELICTVRLGDVGGFWAGDFAFARSSDGSLETDTLYLSSGNLVPSSIYRMTRKDGSWGKPERIFETNSTIEGLVMTSPREAYYVSDNHVFRIRDFSKLEAVLTLEATTRLEDLTIAPAKP